MSLEVGICQVAYWEKEGHHFEDYWDYLGVGYRNNHQQWSRSRGVGNLRFGSIVGRLELGVEGKLLVPCPLLCLRAFLILPHLRLCEARG